MLGLAASVSAQTDDPVLASFREDVEIVLDEFCYDCHGYGSDKGGVVLDGFANDAEILDHELWLRALNNIRKGLMPPSDEHQPSGDQREAIVSWIKEKAFQLDPSNPDPGRITVRRLNRVEYRNTIRELMGTEFDALVEFPADDTGHGFDNIADVLTISPMLLEKYLDAAQKIVAGAVPTEPLVVNEQPVLGKDFKSTVDVAEIEEIATGDIVANAAVAAAEGEATKPDAEIWQAGTVEDEALDLLYYQPASVASSITLEHDGDYQLILDLRAVERYVDNQFDLNKARVVFKADGEVLFDEEFVREGSKGFTYEFDRHLTAGTHDLLFEIHPILPAQPQLRQLRLRINEVLVRGPLAPEYWVTPEKYSRYFPRPVPEAETDRDAYRHELLSDFAFRAFRRPVDASTIDRLAGLAKQVSAGQNSTFEKGVAQAMVAVLASPRFLFREEDVELPPAGAQYALVDEFSLASRLSYFFWSTMPDQELFDLAAAGELRENLGAQVKRMLDDERSSELVANFTGQWLQARDVIDAPISDFAVFLRDKPDPTLVQARATFEELRQIRRENRTEEQQARIQEARNAFRAFFRQPRPRLTGGVRRAMKRETEMYFDHILREDRDVIELIESNYTFLNEELANHYGMEGVDVTGEEMRKVILPEGSERGGVLTQGTVLTVTSNPTRTSPVKRGVFILDNIVGAPPPPPPPNIPALEDVASAEELQEMSLRETLELHASKRMCASCHMRMDPLGLALENFNAMGAFRTEEMGKPIEPEGVLITGEEFTNVQELKRVLATEHREDFLHTLAEKLLTYALGRAMEYYDVETLDQIVHKLDAADGRLSALITGIVESAPFQKSRLTESQLARIRAESSEDTGRIAQTHP